MGISKMIIPVVLLKEGLLVCLCSLHLFTAFGLLVPAHPRSLQRGIRELMPTMQWV